MVGQRDDETQQYGSVSCIPKAFVHDSLAVKCTMFSRSAPLSREMDCLTSLTGQGPGVKSIVHFYSFNGIGKHMGMKNFQKRKDKES